MSWLGHSKTAMIVVGRPEASLRLFGTRESVARDKNIGGFDVVMSQSTVPSMASFQGRESGLKVLARMASVDDSALSRQRILL